MRRDWMIPLALAAVLLAIHAPGIARPFLRHRESELTLYGMMARTAMREGPWIQYHVAAPSLEPFGDLRPFMFPDHPPVPVWLVATGYLVGGVNETATRLVPLLFAVVAIFLFHRLVRRDLDPAWAAVATALFTLMPLFAYFSMTGVRLSMVMAFVLGGLLAYRNLLDTGRRRWLAVLVACQFLACWSDWPGYYLAAAIWAHQILFDRRRRRLAWGLIGLNLVIFGAFALMVYLWDPADLIPLKRLLFAGQSRSWSGFQPFAYLIGEARDIGLYVGAGLSLLTAAWIVTAIRLRRPVDGFASCLLLLGLDQVLFVQIAGEHDYYGYYWAAFFALAGALGLQALWEARRPGRVAAVALAALFAAQSAWILRDRLTREGGYEIDYRLGVALHEHLAPDEGAIVAMEFVDYHMPYYADRFYVTWHPAQGWIGHTFTGPQVEAGPDEFLEFVERERDRYDFVVATTTELAPRHIRFLRSLPLEPFGVPRPDEPWLMELTRRYGEPEQRDGFLFFTLRTPNESNPR